ncbi:MAG: adenylate kinase [Bdellovibrionota bacterium]
MRIVILGPPGAGKGTQAVMLAKEAEIPHISTGDILRAEIKNETELGLKVKAVMDAGNLVSDDLILAVTKDRLSKPDCEKGFLLDGVVRTLPQAEGLDKILAEIERPLTQVIDVVVADEEILARIEKRGQDSGRSDDTREVAENRLKVYKDLTAPVSNYYAGKGLLHKVDGLGSVDQVYSRIRSTVGLA